MHSSFTDPTSKLLVEVNIVRQQGGYNQTEHPVSGGYAILDIFRHAGKNNQIAPVVSGSPR